MPQASRALQAGELVADKYRIEELLGQGGMGAVYAARHIGTGRRFAIKWLRPELAGDAEAEARFLREAMLASAINHPAIVEVYDIGRHGEAPFMVMKLLAGESLGARLKHARFTKDSALAVILPVLDGMAAAHARGIVHRDLKPDNIMLQREGNLEQPKILDFGICKLLGADSRTRLTKTGISLGTPLYMSPEQLRGDVEIDLRADVYALGVILYQLLTGELPFQGNNYPDLVLKIVEGRTRSIRELNPELPLELERIVKRAMAVGREQRHASVAELATELRTLRGGPGKAPSTKPAAAKPEANLPTLPEPSVLPAERSIHTRSGWLLATLAAVALAAFWMLYGNERGASDAPGISRVPAHTNPAPRATKGVARTAVAEERVVAEATPRQSEADTARINPAQTPEPASAPEAPTSHWVDGAPRDSARHEHAREREQERPHHHGVREEQPNTATNEPSPAPARKKPSEIIDPFEQ